MSTYRKPSLYSARRTLERLFANRRTDYVTKEQMFEAWQRDGPEYEDNNNKWLYNKLTALYAYQLVRPIYVHDPYKTLSRLELTDKGKELLLKSRATSPPDIAQVLVKNSFEIDLTIEDVIEAAKKINARLTTHRVRVILESQERI